MPESHDPRLPVGSTAASDASVGASDRRRTRVLGVGHNPRVAAAQRVARERLEPFQQLLGGLAVAVFGESATVMAHLRGTGAKARLVFVVDAADPRATLDYAAFLPREQAFWTAYSQLPKPAVPFAVAVRPARGWSRIEALAPFFAYLPTTDETM